MTGSTPPALLLFSAGADDADFRYATGFGVEQGLYVRFASGDDVLAVSGLELDRARAEAQVARIVDRAELGWTEQADVWSAWNAVAAGLLRSRGLRELRVSPRLAAAHYAGLAAAGFEAAVEPQLFLAERRRKSEAEAAAIRAAQRAAEAACLEVVRQLAAAEAGPDGQLGLGGRPLTSERLAARAQAVLNEAGHVATEMIVAGSPGCALPHFRGAGPIRAGAPVVIDIFPRGPEHYHGDLTRTVVPGGAGEPFRAMHAACVEALRAAVGRLREGADGREVHREACRVLVEHGFGTTTAGLEGRPEGPRMTHSTGHGVGLEVHEAPSLRDLAYPLRAGDVVTVEPGLYQLGLGGIRVENTGMVTATGFEDFTSLPLGLDPADYL